MVYIGLLLMCVCASYTRYLRPSTGNRCMLLTLLFNIYLYIYIYIYIITLGIELKLDRQYKYMVIINVKHLLHEFHLPNCSSYCCYLGNRVSCSEEINCPTIIIGRSLAIT